MLGTLRKVLLGGGMPCEGERKLPLIEVSTVFRVGTSGVDRVLVGFGVGRPDVVTERNSGRVCGIPDDAE